ncbi:endonuclease/exonuclease/phosphatase family protein [Roseomonas sp. USHLN139]|uniref:endonuclease/exonuclease/phosphatase family protein n=1 Tax=Roseomonas sp. USHLN139 TaxID=3081298 RepID=UPI003B013B63
MTWNIHGGIGRDGRYDLERVIALIRRHRPDLLAVQEIDSRPKHRPTPFQALKEVFAGHDMVAETMQGAEEGAYGHMLFSRWPMRDAAIHDLSVERREPRSAILARIETPAGTLGVMATHLGLRWRERQRQARRLAALVRAQEGPLVVMGDFNDWSWRGPVWRALSPLLPARTAHRSFPAHFPLLRLDEIFCRPAGLLGRSWRDRDGAAASDHLPVLAELHMAGGDRATPAEEALADQRPSDVRLAVG